LKFPNTVIGKVLAWRLRNISDRSFIIVLSILIGLLSGVTAILLSLAITEIHHLLTGGFTAETSNYLYIAYPVIGIMVTLGILKFLYRDFFDHGITNVLEAIANKESIVRIKSTLYFIVGSLITVGSGGSVGMEASLVMGGSSAGSNVARYLHLPYQSRLLLLGCGVAGAVAAFFKAPIAGMIFGLEVLMLDLTMSSLIPLLMASLSGILISNIILGDSLVFNFTLNSPFEPANIPFYIVFGVFAAFISVYFTRITNFMEDFFGEFDRTFGRGLIGALVLGLLIFLFPPLYGEGYEAIRALEKGEALQLLNNSIFYDMRGQDGVLIAFLGAIIVFKAFAVAITLGSGGIGGYFAPSLFIGGVSGFFFARLVNSFGFLGNIAETNFLLVGMGGVMSGIFHAPLTGVFLIAELTQGYTFIIPLMLVSTISYTVTIFFEPHSLFTKKLAQKGDLITHDKDQAILTMMKMEKLIDYDHRTIRPNQTLGEILRHEVAESHRNIFPVIGRNCKLLGIIHLDDIRKLLLKTDKHYQLTAKDLMHEPPEYLYTTEDMDSVVNKFDGTNSWNLPVLDEHGKYKGFISKSKIFSAYRSLLVQFSEE
jgi:CIC family chloride channel protein